MRNTRNERRLAVLAVLAGLLAGPACEDPAGGFLVARFDSARCTTDGLDSTLVDSMFVYSNIAGDRADRFTMEVEFFLAPRGTERTGPLLCSDSLEVGGLGESDEDIGRFECVGSGVECPTTWHYRFMGVSHSTGSGEIVY